METDFSTNLSDAERERLAFLLEEMGEAQQIIGKILRHGYESFNPLITPELADTNRQLLEKELGDVVAAITLVSTADDVSSRQINLHCAAKLKRVWQWFHFQPSSLAESLPS